MREFGWQPCVPMTYFRCEKINVFLHTSLFTSLRCRLYFLLSGYYIFFLQNSLSLYSSAFCCILMCLHGDVVEFTLRSHLLLLSSFMISGFSSLPCFHHVKMSISGICVFMYPIKTNVATSTWCRRVHHDTAELTADFDSTGIFFFTWDIDATLYTKYSAYSICLLLLVLVLLMLLPHQTNLDFPRCLPCKQ